MHTKEQECSVIFLEQLGIFNDICMDHISCDTCHNGETLLHFTKKLKVCKRTYTSTCFQMEELRGGTIYWSNVKKKKRHKYIKYRQMFYFHSSKHHLSIQSVIIGKFGLVYVEVLIKQTKIYTQVVRLNRY